MTSFSQTNGRLQKRVRVKASLVEEGTGRGGGVLLLGSRICCCIHPCMHPHAHSVEVSGFLGEAHRQCCDLEVCVCRNQAQVGM